MWQLLEQVAAGESPEWHTVVRHVEALMDEKQKKAVKDGGEHVLHAVEDVADVAGHAVTGAVKGVADGVESASADTKTREADAE